MTEIDTNKMRLEIEAFNHCKLSHAYALCDALDAARVRIEELAVGCLKYHENEIDLVMRAEKAEAAIERARKLAHDMRDWCSPFGVALDYAEHIVKALDGEVS